MKSDTNHHCVVECSEKSNSFSKIETFSVPRFSEDTEIKILNSSPLIYAKIKNGIVTIFCRKKNPITIMTKLNGITYFKDQNKEYLALVHTSPLTLQELPLRNTVMFYSLEDNADSIFTCPHPISFFAVTTDAKNNALCIAASRKKISSFTIDGRLISTKSVESNILALNAYKNKENIPHIATTHYDKNLIIWNTNLEPVVRYATDIQACSLFIDEQPDTLTKIIGSSNDKFYSFEDNISDPNFFNHQTPLIHSHIRRNVQPTIVANAQAPYDIFIDYEHNTMSMHALDGTLLAVLKPEENCYFLHAEIRNENLIIFTSRAEKIFVTKYIEEFNTTKTTITMHAVIARYAVALSGLLE